MIGVDTFDYADGALAGQAGGTGWDYIGEDEGGSATRGPSDWRNITATPPVTGGTVLTNGSAAVRSFTGTTLGSGAGANEREGAIRGTGVVYFGVDYSISTLFAAGQSQWSGFSSYDFGAERVFFGMFGQSGESRYFGVQITGGGNAASPIAVEAGKTYRLVGAVDFDSKLLKLWVNPDATDFDDGTSHSADAQLAYTLTNWSTAVRLGSGGGADTTWDNLIVATTFAEAAAIPETSAALLALLGAAPLAFRRRK